MSGVVNKLRHAARSWAGLLALVAIGLGALNLGTAGSLHAASAHHGAENGGARVTILALGDSLTAGYGLEQGRGFVGQLQDAVNAAGLNAEIVNAGVSGDTSAGGRSRLDWLLTPEVDGAIVELGANDGLRGLDPAETRKNLDWILSRLDAKGIEVLLTGMQAPPNLGKDYGKAFNSIYPDLAERYGAVFDPFFLQDVAAIPELNQEDGIHPTADGVARIVDRMLPKVKTLIERIRAKSDVPMNKAN